jgi:hypothetical protein
MTADDRFMPKRLGVLLAKYLVTVRPLGVFLSERFKCKGAEDLNEFMWADFNTGLWTGDYISDLLKQTCCAVRRFAKLEDRPQTKMA